MAPLGTRFDAVPLATVTSASAKPDTVSLNAAVTWMGESFVGLGDVVLSVTVGPTESYVTLSTLLAALPDHVAEGASADNETIRFGSVVSLDVFEGVIVDGIVPEIAPQAVDGLKFSAALPAKLAMVTLAQRYVDKIGALDRTR